MVGGPSPACYQEEMTALQPTEAHFKQKLDYWWAKLP